MADIFDALSVGELLEVIVSSGVLMGREVGDELEGEVLRVIVQGWLPRGGAATDR